MILLMKNAAWFDRKTVWSMLALGVFACGGQSTNTVADDGSGGAPLGGEKGDSGGRGSSDGGAAAGGKDGSGSSSSAGGNGTGGAETSDGGSSSGGTSTGGDSSDGGSPGTGGGNGDDDHLDGLGDECETPGEFSCSAANELLALICGGDKKWAVRETCESGEKCDFRSGSGVGLCLAPIEGCETNTSEPFCGAEGVETCMRGGFETEVTEECGEGYGCENADCVMVDDECPEGTVYECDGFEVCGGSQVPCGTEMCSAAMPFVGAGPLTIRIPESEFCLETCAEEPNPGFTVFASRLSLAPDFALRVRAGPGWRVRATHVENDALRTCTGQPADECIVVPIQRTTSEAYAAVTLYPLTDPPVIRNVVVDEVPLGTTCED